MKKKVLSGLLAAAMVFSGLSPCMEVNAETAGSVTREMSSDAGDDIENAEDRSFENPFTDVSPGDWYYDSIAYVYDHGIMTGLDGQTFGPIEPLARAQFALILYRMNEEPETEYRDIFPDVPDDQWYTDAILWASQSGIVTGYGNTGRFGPSDNINREQMAVMMYRYAGFMKYDTGNRADFSGYLDAENVNDFAREAMEWAVGNGIITGKYNETVLDPQGNASRAECATIIMRFMDRYETPSALENSRAEWISRLIDVYGYPMVEDQGELYYTDIPDEYRDVIQTAVSYGILIPGEDGEEFHPDEAATREFAAVTAVRSLGYQLGDDISCADSSSITYPEEVNIAVETDLLSLENGYFYPQRTLSENEAENILKMAEEIYNSTQPNQSGKNEIAYREETIVLDDSTAYEDNGNQVIFPVNALRAEIKKDSIITVGRKAAFKVTDYAIEGNEYVISYTTPDLNEFIDSMDVDGQLALDFSNFIPADGVTVEENSANMGISTYGFMDDAFDIPETSIDTGAKIKLSGDIDLGEGWKINYSLDTEIPTVDYKFDIDFGFLSANVKNAYLKIKQNTEVNIDFGKDFDGSDYGKVVRDDMLYRYIQLGRIPALGIDGVGVVVEIDLVFNAAGKAEVVYNLGGTLGCQVLNNKVRNISALKSTTSVGITGEAKIGPKIGLVAEIFEKDLISFSADAGVKAAVSLTIRDTGMVCADGHITLYAELSALDDTLIDDWLDVAVVWTIWDDSNSPVNFVGHFENMKLVEKCTYNVDADIPDDALVFNGHYYKFYDESMTWEEARDFCELKGGHLVTINSEEEQNAIFRYIQQFGVNADIWIGITDAETEGDWSHWITGEEVSYTNWGSGEPDDDKGNGQDYGVICSEYRSGSGYEIQPGEWDDISEYDGINTGSFICEWDNEG